MEINNLLNGINNDLMDDLIKDINTYADDILIIFNQINDSFVEGIDYFVCDIKESLKELYEIMSDNFKIINSNILSYGTDYVRVKQAYLNRGLSIVNQVNSMEVKNISEKGE